MHYRNQIHEKIYTAKVRNNPYHCSNSYLAALYLLSADVRLWELAKPVIGKTDIRFDEMGVVKCSPMGYTLRKAANDLYTGTSYLALNDLGDSYLVSKKEFELIMTALRISWYGYSYLGIERKYR